ncbi:hypothetical protein NV379_02370 [Paenibacillus sp. N1-5-1-14]|uniref:hypothetical protein n=1 Tax=Paenibacillus radicibacter TaxID=2972488 RepID=UPI002159AE54|nr:hypothetical protein [Paenibacillus radicibacter]MCR8641492.1 hypothetical protein [Paenibacillus radicibacter]
MRKELIGWLEVYEELTALYDTRADMNDKDSLRKYLISQLDEFDGLKVKITIETMK